MYGAGDEARTRDLNLGKVALYQLSYSRIVRLTAANLLQLLCYCSVASNCVHRRNEIMEKRLKRVNPFCECL